jgi:hypothetical protein
MNKEGVELFHIGEDKTGYHTYDTVYIKDTKSVAVSSADGANIALYLANYSRSLCLC